MVPMLLRLFAILETFFGLAFALALFLGWLSGKIEVHISRIRKEDT